MASLSVPRSTICGGDTCADNNLCTVDGKFAHSDLNIPSSEIEDILNCLGFTKKAWLLH